MIKCKICEHESKFRLIEHIQKIHKMNIDEYKIKYGEVVSEEYKEIVSKKSKDKWKEDDYRQKTMDSRKWIYSDNELNKKRIQSIKNYYDNGGKVWNDGLTKNDDIRLKSIGEKNKINLSGRTKENYDYLEKHSKLMISLWDQSKLKIGWIDVQNDPIKNKKWRNKISETITNKILSGEINPFSYFKYGWYKNNDGDHWYSSNLELESMKLMDKLKINWSNNHKIKIKYIQNKKEHYYIPDFLLNIKNNDYIIEMKGFDWDGNTELKSECAKKEYQNYYIFYNILDFENFLHKTLT